MIKMIEIDGVKWYVHYQLVYNGSCSCGLPVVTWLERVKDNDD